MVKSATFVSFLINDLFSLGRILQHQLLCFSSVTMTHILLLIRTPMELNEKVFKVWLTMMQKSKPNVTFLLVVFPKWTCHIHFNVELLLCAESHQLNRKCSTGISSLSRYCEKIQHALTVLDQKFDFLLISCSPHWPTFPRSAFNFCINSIWDIFEFGEQALIFRYENSLKSPDPVNRRDNLV